MTFLDSMAPLSGIPFISNGSLQISAERVSTAERALALSCGPSRFPAVHWLLCEACWENCRAMTDLYFAFDPVTPHCRCLRSLEVSMGQVATTPRSTFGSCSPPLRSGHTIEEPCKGHTRNGQRSPLLHSVVFYLDSGANSL